MKKKSDPLDLSGFSYFIIFIMEKIAYYTFVFESSGFMVESPFILPVGTTFEYWGLNWIVSVYNEDENNLNLICERI